MRKEGEKKQKKIFEWALILLSFYIIFSLARGVWELMGVSGRLEEIKGELVVEEKRGGEIEARIREATSEAYVERVARDKLNMQKEGETVVVLVDEIDQLLGGDLEGGDGEGVEEANWLKWWELIN